MARGGGWSRLGTWMVEPGPEKASCVRAGTGMVVVTQSGAGCSSAILTLIHQLTKYLEMGPEEHILPFKSACLRFYTFKEHFLKTIIIRHLNKLPQPEIQFYLMSKVRSPTGDRAGGACAGVARPASTGRQLAASDKHEHTTRDPHSRPSTVSRAGASDTAGPTSTPAIKRPHYSSTSPHHRNCVTKISTPPPTTTWTLLRTSIPLASTSQQPRAPRSPPRVTLFAASLPITAKMPPLDPTGLY